jgi:hypothetical protein
VTGGVVHADSVLVDRALPGDFCRYKRSGIYMATCRVIQIVNAETTVVFTATGRTEIAVLS